MTVHGGCRGREKVCLGAATVLPLHGRGGDWGEGWAVPQLVPLLVVGSGHMWPRALRRKWDTGAVGVVLMRWDMGKKWEWGQLSILFICPPGVFTHRVLSACPIFPPVCPCRVVHWHLQTATTARRTRPPLSVGAASASLHPPAHGSSHATPAVRSALRPCRRDRAAMQDAVTNKKRALPARA